MKDYERHYFAQCSDCMLDGQRNRAVDYIINFEKYACDVRYLLDYVGHPYSNDAIPVVNPSAHAHCLYRDSSLIGFRVESGRLFEAKKR